MTVTAGMKKASIVQKWTVVKETGDTSAGVQVFIRSKSKALYREYACQRSRQASDFTWKRVSRVAESTGAIETSQSAKQSKLQKFNEKSMNIHVLDECARLRKKKLKKEKDAQFCFGCLCSPKFMGERLL